MVRAFANNCCFCPTRSEASAIAFWRRRRPSGITSRACACDPVTSDDACLMEWRASFEPPPQERGAARALRARGDHGGGFRRTSARADCGAAAAHGRSHLCFLREPARRPRASRSRSRATAARRFLFRGARRSGRPASAKCASRRRRSASISSTSIAAAAAFDLVPPGGVLGMEAAGVVESVGPGVGNVRPGDRVAYACAPPGAYASMRTMRADLLVRLPESHQRRDRRGAAAQRN